MYTHKLQESLQDLLHAYIFTCNSYYNTFHAIYLTCKLQKGDEVILSPIAFAATATLFVSLGITPVWCDVRLDGNIDETKIEALITPRTKAILVHNFAGKICNIEHISALSRKHKLLLIQDAPFNLGSTITNLFPHTFADITIYGFGSINTKFKDAGAVLVVNDDEMAHKLHYTFNNGIEKRKLYNYDVIRTGFDLKLSDTLSELILSHLPALKSNIERSMHITSVYETQLSHSKLFLTQKTDVDQKVFHGFFPIILNPELHCPKEDIYLALREHNIDVSVEYKPIYQHTLFKQTFHTTPSLHVANDFYLSELSLPLHPAMSDIEIHTVAEKFLQTVDTFSYRGCTF